jgi:hypothetical protein
MKHKVKWHPVILQSAVSKIHFYDGPLMINESKQFIQDEQNTLSHTVHIRQSFWVQPYRVEIFSIVGRLSTDCR